MTGHYFLTISQQQETAGSLSARRFTLSRVLPHCATMDAAGDCRHVQPLA